MTSKHKIELGDLVVTSTLEEHCDIHNINLQPFIDKYIEKQWGELSPDDLQANNDEINEISGHVLGKYNLPTGEDIYIETSWNDTERSTVIMFCTER